MPSKTLLAATQTSSTDTRSWSASRGSNELRDLLGDEFRLVLRHEGVAVVNLDESGVGEDFGPTFGVREGKLRGTAGPQQQHGPAEVPQTLSGSQRLLVVDGPQEAVGVPADAAVGQQRPCP